MKENLKALAIVVLLLGLLIFIIIGLGDALFPLFISVFLAYIFFPLIKKVEDRGINRIYVVSAVFVFASLFIITSLILVIPKLISEAQGFVAELPKTLLYLVERVEFFSQKIGFPIQLNQGFLRDFFHLEKGNVSDGIISNFSNSLSGVLAGAFSWVMFILNFLLIPLFFFFVILDYERLVKEIKSFIPSRLQPQLNYYAQLSNEVLSAYFRGQLLVAGLLSVLYAFGLWMVDLKFGIFIGVMSGLISVIPYAGFSIGFFTALLFGVAQQSSLYLIGGIVAVYFIVQLFEGFLITPYIVGKKVGLKAFSTILSLIIGGNLFGLPGMLLAIPVAAISKHLLSDLKQGGSIKNLV